jgi:hypothetical protein
VNSSAIPYCPPDKSVSKTQMSAARCYLDWSAASARLLFDGDDAILLNTVRTPSRRGHRSLPAAAARCLCGRNLNWRGYVANPAISGTSKTKGLPHIRVLIFQIWERCRPWVSHNYIATSWTGLRADLSFCHLISCPAFPATLFPSDYHWVTWCIYNLQKKATRHQHFTPMIIILFTRCCRLTEQVNILGLLVKFRLIDFPD